MIQFQHPILDAGMKASIAIGFFSGNFSDLISGARVSFDSWHLGSDRAADTDPTNTCQLVSTCTSKCLQADSEAVDILLSAVSTTFPVKRKH